MTVAAGERNDLPTAGEWDALREIMEVETGMDLAEPRFGRLKNAVLRVAGQRNFARLLEQPAEKVKFLEQLTTELTVGESFFLRNEYHFQALREEVLPRILTENAQRQDVRVWSAGCATGEEPYSLAILLDQLLCERPGWRYSILGTDLNVRFLERAREGFYRPWSFRRTRVHDDIRFFQKKGDGYQLHERVRKQVRFAYLNLVKDVFPSFLTGTVGLDLILFRNVAIYLKAEVTAAILQRFCQALRPGGWLLLGETEINLAPTAGFSVYRCANSTFLKKLDDGSPQAFAPTPIAISTPVMADVGQWISDFTFAVPKIPQWVPLPYVERTAAASSGLNTLAVLPPEPRFQQALQEGDFAAAVRGLLSFDDVSARSVARLLLVRKLLDHAQCAFAREQLQLCLKENPLLLEAHLLQASLSEEEGKTERAVEAYRRALYLDRNCCIAHFHLALLQRATGDYDGAGKSYQTVLKLCDSQDGHAIVEFGDGVCYGRLRELAVTLFGEEAV
ncbi:CheR family methyltransferase [Planctomicrobium sp. SH664]|uniref:CheR family methyltransferase n=1 Tax=Planctomicrobium sp. SH664 TaxID=3448125 RepID=UPI003F5C2C37